MTPWFRVNEGVLFCPGHDRPFPIRNMKKACNMMRRSSPFLLLLIGLSATFGQTKVGIQPDSLNFGSLVVDSSRSLQCTITNTDTTAFHISSITTSDSAFTAQCTTMTVGKGSTALLTVTFTPTSPRLYSAEVTIVSDDSNHTTLKVHVRGQGSLVQSISPTSSNINVPDTARVLISLARAIDLGNITDSSIVVTGRNSGTHRGTVTYDGSQHTLTWRTTDRFLPGECVTALMTGGLRTMQNDTIPPFQWSFTIAPGGGSAKFTLTNSLDVGDISGDVVTGDFDRNGYLDLAYSIRAYQTVYVISNHGDSGLTKTSAPSTSEPDRIVSADFNGDGYPEFATASGSGTSVTISKRQPDGSFAEAATINTGAWCGALGCGDIDGDGRPDIVFVGAYPTTIFMFRNLGNFQFQQVNQIPYGSSARTLSMGDLDGDGDLDLVLGLSYYHTALLFEHLSGFEFAAPRSITLGGEPISVLCGDFDNDGDADIATLTRSNDNVSILRNDSLWHFTRTGDSWVSYGLSFAAGDFDHNGSLDIVASSIDGDLILLANNGNMSFTRSVISHAGSYYRAVAAGDFDNDGDIDIASTIGYDNTLVIARNRNSDARIHLLTDSYDFRTARLDSSKFTVMTIINEGAVQPLQITSMVSSNPAFSLWQTEATVAAMETLKVVVQFKPAESRAYGDTITIMSNDTTRPVARFLVKGKGDQVISLYPMPYSYAASETTHIDIRFGVRLDASTLSDTTVKVRGSQSGLHKSKSLTYDQGTRTLTITPAAAFHPGETVTIGLTTGIHTLPGDPAFLPRTWDFTVRSKNSCMTFRSVNSTTLPGGLVGVVLADFDGDGLQDIAALSHDQPTLTFFKNNGHLSFTIKSSMSLGSSPELLRGADLDNDGDIDLVGPEVGGSIRLFRNDGNFSFTSMSVAAPGYMQRLTIGDYDGDGYLDLAAGTGSSSAEFNYIRNKGNFVFEVIPAASTYSGLMYTADFDNDGLPDIAYRNFPDGIMRNEGNFTFSTPAGPLLSTFPTTSGDFNRDGQLDVAGPYGDVGWYFGILLNKGDLSYKELRKDAPSSGVSSVTATDIDGDRFPDFLLRYSTGLAVVHSDSAMNIHAESVLALPNLTVEMAIGDLDNDGDNDIVTVSCFSNILTILEHRDHYSEIRLSAARYNFGTVLLDSTKTYSLRVSNDGSLPLHLDSVISSSAAFTAQPASAVISPKDSVTVTVSFQPDSSLYYSDSLSFFSDDKEHPVVRFYVTGRPFQPFVDSVYPAPHAIRGTGGQIVVHLAQPIVPASLADSTVRVFGAQSGLHRAELSYDSPTRTMTGSPSGKFLPGEMVTVVLTRGVRLASGVPLISGFSWSYRVPATEGIATFSARGDVSIPSNPWCLCPADFNNDGIADLAVLRNSTSKMMMLRSEMWAGPSAKEELLMPAFPTFVTSGDFNADGKCDLVVLSASAVTFVKNDSTRMINKGTYYLAGSLLSATVADLDADGDLDVAVASYPANRVTILWNQGNWAFTPQELAMDIQGPVTIRSGDFDNDGDMDLLVAKQLGNNFSILQNNLNGVFTDVLLPNIAGYIRTIEIGDFDRDGDLDIVAGNSNMNSANFLVNEGNLAFNRMEVSGIGSEPFWFAGADFDHDGDVDLATVGLIYLYNNMNFSQSGQFSGGTGANSVVTGDFDGDGAIDIALANDAANSVRLLHNNLSEGFTFSPLTVNFGKVQTGNTASSRVILRNVGTKIMKVDSLHIRKGAFSASINKSYVAAGDTAIITVSFHPDSVRAYGDTLFIETAKPWFNLVILGGEGSPVSDVADGVDIMPVVYTLFQNYPNPFNPATTIRYALPRRSRVLLRVYNSLGQLVQMLVDETQDAGYRLIQFDGSKLASGVYFYRIQCEEFVDTKKFLLVK
jgi:large repetitive protein